MSDWKFSESGVWCYWDSPVGRYTIVEEIDTGIQRYSVNLESVRKEIGYIQVPLDLLSNNEKYFKSAQKIAEEHFKNNPKHK